MSCTEAYGQYILRVPWRKSSRVESTPQRANLARRRCTAGRALPQRKVPLLEPPLLQSACNTTQQCPGQPGSGCSALTGKTQHVSGGQQGGTGLCALPDGATAAADRRRRPRMQEGTSPWSLALAERWVRCGKPWLERRGRLFEPQSLGLVGRTPNPPTALCTHLFLRRKCLVSRFSIRLRVSHFRDFRPPPRPSAVRFLPPPGRRVVLLAPIRHMPNCLLCFFRLPPTRARAPRPHRAHFPCIPNHHATDTSPAPRLQEALSLAAAALLLTTLPASQVGLGHRLEPFPCLASCASLSQRGCEASSS